MNKKLFYILNCTCGCLMTVIGALTALVLLIAGKRPERYGYCWHFTVGHGWGGVSLGLVFLTDDEPTEHTKNHEHGHAIQNARFGILMPFLVGIPSVIRYWYRELRYYRRGDTPPTKYDDIWFEGQATQLGTDLIDELKNADKKK